MHPTSPSTAGIWGPQAHTVGPCEPPAPRGHRHGLGTWAEGRRSTVGLCTDAHSEPSQMGTMWPGQGIAWPALRACSDPGLHAQARLCRATPIESEPARAPHRSFSSPQALGLLLGLPSTSSAFTFTGPSPHEFWAPAVTPGHLPSSRPEPWAQRIKIVYYSPV